MELTIMLDAACEGNNWTREGHEVSIPLRGDRVQRVYAELFDVEDREQRVRLFTEIGDAGQLAEGRLRAALAVNFGLTLGTLAIREGRLVMSETLPPDRASTAEFSKTILYLAETADRYEQHLFGTDDH